MLKWILTLVLAVFLLGIAAPHLARLIRLGRLPGDIALRWRGQVYNFPLASTVLLSFFVWLVGRLL